MNAANRPSRPSVAKQSKHKRRPAKPPNKPRPPPRRGGGAGLEKQNEHVVRRLFNVRLTELDIVDQVVQCIGIPNDGQALELGAF